jgi:hypothetical protein
MCICCVLTDIVKTLNQRNRMHSLKITYEYGRSLFEGKGDLGPPLNPPRLQHGLTYLYTGKSIQTFY